MANNLELTLPAGEGYSDLQTATQTSRVYSNNDDVFSLVNLVNKYLWFALWVVAMVVLVIAGFKLVTARWDEKEMKKVNTMLIWLVVWVFIAIFSYLIVRVVANLF